MVGMPAGGLVVHTGSGPGVSAKQLPSTLVVHLQGQKSLADDAVPSLMAAAQRHSEHSDRHGCQQPTHRIHCFMNGSLCGGARFHACEMAASHQEREGGCSAGGPAARAPGRD